MPVTLSERGVYEVTVEDPPATVGRTVELICKHPLTGRTVKALAAGGPEGENLVFDKLDFRASPPGIYFLEISISPDTDAAIPIYPESNEDNTLIVRDYSSIPNKP